MERTLLQGIRVVDFGWVQTGPQTGKILADCGAQVIKCEGRTRPDTVRRGRDGSFNRRYIFNQWNTSKLSLAINLSRPKAKEVIKKLVAKSDVVLDNFAAGAMDRMGFGYEELKKIKPDIIMISSNGLGQTGPYAAIPAHGNALVALAGITQITGWPDRMPSLLGNYTDFIAPRFNALAIIAALDHHRRTGEGMYIDSAQVEGTIHFMAPLLLDYAVNQRIANRRGNRVDYAAPHGAYRCLGDDRWCAIAVFTDAEWRAFCQVIGNPRWTKYAKFSTILDRKKNEDELDKLVESWTMNQTAEDVMTRMQTAGVPAGILATGEDVVEHNPQLKEQHFLWEVEHPEMGRYIAHRTPFIPSKAHYELRRAPLLGEHNGYVLREILGLSEGEIAKLVADGSIE